MTVFDPNEPFELAAYDPHWPEMFAAEQDQLAAALGDHALEIEHIGSTAIPGLRAKPVIDILVAVDEFDAITFYRDRLEPLGYHHHAHADEHDRIFFWKGVPRTHHLHIVEYATWEHQRHLIFRDYLRAHPAIARLYATVKGELHAAHTDDRPAYTRGKADFIRAVTTRAVDEIKNPGLRDAVPPDDEQLIEDWLNMNPDH